MPEGIYEPKAIRGNPNRSISNSPPREHVVKTPQDIKRSGEIRPKPSVTSVHKY